MKLRPNLSLCSPVMVSMFCIMACLGAIVGSLPTIRVDVSMFPHLTGFMFAYERLVSGYWWRCCLAHGHQPPPPGDMQSRAVFFGRFCPLFYFFKGHIMKNKRQCCQLWRCEMLHPRPPGGRWSEIPGPCWPHKSWPGLNINQSWGKLTNHFNICQNTSTFCEEDFSFFGEHHSRIC